jgi:hypothetical protein
MSFLKKLGSFIAKAQQVVGGIAPLVPFLTKGETYARYIDAVDDGLVEAAQVVVMVEGVGAALSLEGSAKLTAAAPQIAAIVKHRLVAGKKIDNVAQFDAGVAQLTSGIVAILNSLDASEVEAA